jgi:hypothetical protein
LTPDIGDDVPLTPDIGHDVSLTLDIGHDVPLTPDIGDDVPLDLVQLHRNNFSPKMKFADSIIAENEVRRKKFRRK